MRKRTERGKRLFTGEKKKSRDNKNKYDLKYKRKGKGKKEKIVGPPLNEKSGGKSTIEKRATALVARKKDAHILEGKKREKKEVRPKDQSINGKQGGTQGGLKFALETYEKKKRRRNGKA